MIVINGEGLVAGRLATFAAKQALNGETVNIVNCEQIFITGSKEFILRDVHRKRVQGTWSKGPHFFRQPDRFVRRIIRGMLPYKTNRGITAYRRIMCYIGMPEEFKNEKQAVLKDASIKLIPNLRYMKVADICKHMGAK